MGVQKQWMEVLGGHVADEREECELEVDVGEPLAARPASWSTDGVGWTASAA